MSSTWVTSDWHLGHKSIETFEPSRGPDFEERLVSNYMACVAPQDTVWFLGDMTFRTNRLDVYRALPGRKFMVLGNHDRLSVRRYYEAGFQAVLPLYAWHIMADGTPVLLSHFPASKAAQDARYKEERLRLRDLRQGHINYHGHTHSWVSPDPKLINVCPENTNYYPALLESL